ncbi:MAG: hypothetical protein KBT20_10965 [Bacteroidales bacterium]|nr:hypothetical protein [Candidatus Liminaster caballi]
MDWKEMLAATMTAEQLAEGAAQNKADEERRHEQQKEAEERRHDQKKAAGRLGQLRIEYDKKGRKGKPCTIISGFHIEEDELARLRRLLQTRLATGGSHCINSEDPFDGQILLQGDCRQRAAEILRSEGYSAK